jgi:cytoskeletal protein CcmA (bactofilin family)
MNNKFILILIAILVVAVNSIFSTQMKTGADIKDNKIYEDDYLFKGKNLDFSGKADDIYFIGEALKFNGETKSNINAVGDKIIINGKIGNNIHAGARLVEISNNVKSNAYIVGGTIILQKGSSIDGTLFTLSKDLIIKNDAVINSGIFSSSGNVTISGTVNGDLKIYAGTLTIDGIINGNIKTEVGKIVFTNNSKLNGNLTYTAEYMLTDFDKSKIAGSVEFIKDDFNRHENFNHHFFIPHHKNFEKKFKSDFLKAMIFIKIFTLIGFIIAGLLILLFPVTKKFEKTSENNNFWYTMLWGLIPFFIYPVVIIFLIALVVTIPLGITLIMLGLPLLLILQIIGVVLFGQYLFNIFKWNITNRYFYFLFGLIFFVIISIIPLINFLGLIFFTSLGWGQIIQVLFNKKLTS